MNLLVATCSTLLPQGSDKAAFRIIPAGRFKSVDGRPVGGSWLLTAERGAEMVAAAAIRANDYVIDYEHQTLLTAENGKPAPAAGWFHKLEWRADGLYIIDARWTAEARKMIDAHEYRFVSPVFIFDKNTFEVQELQNVAITNAPGLHGLTDLALLKSGAQPAENDAIEAFLKNGSTEKDLANMRHVFGEDIVQRTAESMREKKQQDSAALTAKDREYFQIHFGLKL